MQALGFDVARPCVHVRARVRVIMRACVSVVSFFRALLGLLASGAEACISSVRALDWRLRGG